ncbi:MAG: hypothetical protein QGG40_11665, partial [Myxococcota bacterium]|nr:hypothetical protein [Myxococcota bacterium]
MMEMLPDTLMLVVPHLVLALLVVAGLVGCVIPGLPGALLIVVGALLHGWWTGWEPIGPLLVSFLAVLSLVSWGL